MKAILFSFLLIAWCHNNGTAQSISKVTLEFRTPASPSGLDADNDKVKISFRTAAGIVIAEGTYSLSELSSSPGATKDMGEAIYTAADLANVKGSRIKLSLLSKNDNLRKWAFDMELCIQSGSTKYEYSFSGGSLSRESRDFTANVIVNN